MFLESTQAFIFHSIPCSNVGCYSNGQNLIRREHIVKIADASCHTPLSSRCRRKRHLRVSSTDERTDSWRAIRYHSAYPLAERRRRREEPLNMAERGVGGADEPAAVSGVVVDVVVEQGACVSVKDSFLTVDDPFEELEDRPRYRCVVHDNTSKPPKPYNKGWEWQKQALAQLAAHPDDLSEPDAVLMTQHGAVFTLGTGSTLDNLKFAPDEAPFDVVRTERGGEVTYHGPGQIVMYPIMNLRRYRQDIHWYLRALEETVIRTLAKLGLRGERIKGLTGVWVEGRKVAAVGVRVKRWITMHGLSLNVSPDLGHFKHIVPCGIGDRPVGSLKNLCAEGQDFSMERVSKLLLESFEEVFGVEGVAAEEPAESEQPHAR